MSRIWNLFKELAGDLLTIVGGAMMLYVFITIEIYGRYAQEPNQYIRWVELLMGGGIVALGIERLIMDIIRIRNEKKTEKIED
jgi:hypothetical protein